MSNRWDQPGVPHKGWRCVGVYDVREDGSTPDEAAYATCEMCGREKIRFVHTMEHDQHQPLDVGCVCAGKMSDDYAGAEHREAAMKNRAARRSKWLTRKWRHSAKGNAFLNVEGFNIVIFPSKRRPGTWGYKVGAEFGREGYPSETQAKLAAFDDLWRKTNPGDSDVVIIK
jgi:hypothetical protein